VRIFKGCNSNSVGGFHIFKFDAQGKGKACSRNGIILKGGVGQGCKGLGSRFNHFLRLPIPQACISRKRKRQGCGYPNIRFTHKASSGKMETVANSIDILHIFKCLDRFLK
jgi:hypothetical protein